MSKSRTFPMYTEIEASVVPQPRKILNTQSPNQMSTSLLRPFLPMNATCQSVKLRPLLSTPLYNSSIAHHFHWRHRMQSVSATAANPPGGTSAVASQEITSSLESVRVFDLNGKEVTITDLWKDRKAVVAFARHFGCVLCRKRADLLASKKDEMDAAGVALVLIGPGSVDQAKTFSEQTKFPGEIYADPNHSSYDALKFAYGVLTTFTPSAGVKIIQLYMEGYRQDWKLSFEKDTVAKGGWQQGGLLVAGPGLNNILYIHKDKEAGDDPDVEDVLKACCL